MTIASPNIIPNLLLRRKIDADDLRRLEEPAVIFEYQSRDSDGVLYFVYTVAGFLDGANIFNELGGATVGGDAIIIIADTRAQADDMASLGLQDTINALNTEQDTYLDALAAKERLSSVSKTAFIDASISKEKNEAFITDIDKIQTLRGDDLIMAQGH